MPWRIVVEDRMCTILEMKVKKEKIAMATIPVSIDKHNQWIKLKPLRFPQLIQMIGGMSKISTADKPPV